MMKRLVVLLACIGLAAPMAGCSLFKSSQPESEVAADMDSADLEGLEGEESVDLAEDSLEVAADDSLASDQLPEEALGETESMDLSEAPLELSDTEQPDIAAEMDTLPADPFGESGAQDAPPPAEEPLMAETTPPAETDSSSFGATDTSSDSTYETSDSSTTIVESEEEPVKKNIPLQKIPTTPWKVGKAWFNTVYFAKPGDSLAQISKTIYGEDRTEQLKRGNPTFNSRDVKPGDKVYYNSPNRPDDSSRMITYYEDNGMSPEVYVARAGDNIRTVSKDLLGYDNAWKEVWASNSVDSKGEIAEGTELRYWKGGTVAAAPRQAQPEMAPPAPAEQMPPQDFPQAEMAPPPVDQMPPQQAGADVPPPPMPDEQQPMDMGAMPPQDPAMDMAQEQLPPPPPPMEEAINPPPPPPQMVAEEDQGAPATDEDTTLALAVVGLAAAGLAILIVMRKKRRQRELEQQAMDNTHVGT